MWLFFFSSFSFSFSLLVWCGEKYLKRIIAIHMIKCLALKNEKTPNYSGMVASLKLNRDWNQQKYILRFGYMHMPIMWFAFIEPSQGKNGIEKKRKWKKQRTCRPYVFDIEPQKYSFVRHKIYVYIWKGRAYDKILMVHSWVLSWVT